MFTKIKKFASENQYEIALTLTLASGMMACMYMTYYIGVNNAIKSADYKPATDTEPSEILVQLRTNSWVRLKDTQTVNHISA